MSSNVYSETEEVTEIRGHIQNGSVAHYQVTIKVGFQLDGTG